MIASRTFCAIGVAALAILALGACRNETPSAPAPPQSATASRAEALAIITPLIDPTKLDTLKGKRAATPRLRKACYWLETAKRAGDDPSALIAEAHQANGIDETERERIQREALLRNLTILERLGCLEAAGMDKLKHGKAPTITKGPYAGELATADHILPRSVVPELDNAIFNLEFLPQSLNEDKSNKIGDRQRQLARKWHGAGLLSDEGLQAVKESS